MLKGVSLVIGVKIIPEPFHLSLLVVFFNWWCWHTCEMCSSALALSDPVWLRFLWVCFRKINFAYNVGPSWLKKYYLIDSHYIFFNCLRSSFFSSYCTILLLIWWESSMSDLKIEDNSFIIDKLSVKLKDMISLRSDVEWLSEINDLIHFLLG